MEETSGHSRATMKPMKPAIRRGTKVILKTLDGGDLPAKAIGDEDPDGGALVAIPSPVKGSPCVVVYVEVSTVAFVDPARWDEFVNAMYAAQAATAEKKG